MTKFPKKLDSIQALRALAAILVLLFHTQIILLVSVGIQNNIKSINISSFDFDIIGHIGVDIFFVISGFIMLYTCYEKTNDKTQFIPFLRKRVQRIYSGYWLILFIAIIPILAFSTLPPFNIQLIKNIFLVPIESREYYLSVAWTLSFELIFYLLFSLYFFLKDKVFKYYLLTWALIIIIFPLIIKLDKQNSPYINFLLSPFHIEFIAGCCVGLLVKNNILKLPRASLICGCLIIAITIYMTIYAPENRHTAIWQKNILWKKTIWQTLPYALGGALIIYGIVQLELLNKIKIPNIFIKLGNASYSLYLVHFPIIGIITPVKV